MKKYVLIAWKLECDAGVVFYLVIVNKHCDWFCYYFIFKQHFKDKFIKLKCSTD